SEILRSSERVTTEEILQFQKMKDIRSFLADRKISELSYGGLRMTQDFIHDRLGVSLFERAEEEQLLTAFVELRNIHTHNRGIINRLFLNRVGRSKHKDFNFKIGELYHVNFPEFIRLTNNCIIVARRLDDAIAKKFKLKRVSFRKRDSRSAGRA